MNVKSEMLLGKLKLAGAKRQTEAEEMASGHKRHKEKTDKEKHQLRMGREQGAMCLSKCGVHDDVVVGCYGNDAMGGNGCYDSCN